MSHPNQLEERANVKQKFHDPAVHLRRSRKVYTHAVGRIQAYDHSSP